MTRFDFHDGEGIAGAKNYRLVRLVFSALLIFAVAVSIYLVLSLVEAGGSVSYRAVLAFPAILITGTLALILANLSPRPVAVEVDEQSIRLMYPRQAPWTISWPNPGFSLRLARTSGASDLMSGGQPAFVLLGRRPRQNLLTRGAFGEIVRVARSKGLRVEEGPPRRGWTTLSICVS